MLSRHGASLVEARSVLMARSTAFPSKVFRSSTTTLVESEDEET